MPALSSIGPPQRTDWFGGAPRDCDSIRARLHEYVDDELDLHVPTERAILLAVAHHVASCARCARIEAQLRAMHLAVAAVGARMRLVDRPRLPSLKAELAIVQLVTTQANACALYAPAAEIDATRGDRSRDSGRRWTAVDLLHSRDRAPEAPRGSHSAGRD